VLGAPRLRRSDALCWSSDQVKAGREADPRTRWIRRRDV